MIRLVTPFPPWYYTTLWEWLQEFPEHNFADFGPKTFDEFREEMERRQERGWKLYLALWGNLPAGAIGYQRLDEPQNTTAWFRGIAFTRSVHGSGVPLGAVFEVLKRGFDEGVERVYAEFFADNIAVAKFLKKLAAKDCDMQGDVWQSGKLIPYRTVSITRDDFRALRRSGTAKEHSDPSSDLSAHA
jgi:RimJ/RimL family protein N-acetyltransferase